MDANAERREGDDTGGEENDQGAIECEMEISPNGTKQWLPTANPEETPYVGQQFKTAEEAILFYQAYARAVGFDVRHSTMRKTREGKVAIKYMYSEAVVPAACSSSGPHRQPSLRLNRAESRRQKPLVIPQPQTPTCVEASD
nr:protein FAR1-RELATED SEQUENCE 5-like [Ipomoea batatas]